MPDQHPFRFGVVSARAASGEEWIAKARRVEALGFSTLLMPDRIGPLLSPLPALAAAAAATTTLRVSPYVLANGLRNPVMLAQEGATVDFLSNGRFELGLGAGVSEEDFRKAGLPFEPPGARVDRLAETIATVKRIWSGQAGGDQAPAGRMASGYLRPIQQPHPPILVAASGKRLISVAAKEAGIIALGLGADQGEAGLWERIEWIRQAAGERFSQIELNVNLVAVVGENGVPPAVRERLRNFFQVDLEQLIAQGSPFVLAGSADQMRDRLLALRQRFGISYIAVSDEMMETLAPVVGELAGR